MPPADQNRGYKRPDQNRVKTQAARIIRIVDVTSGLGEEWCAAITFIHALSGCDVTSNMVGIGKKTAWNAWISFPHEAVEDPSFRQQRSTEKTG